MVLGFRALGLEDSENISSLVFRRSKLSGP